MEMRSLKKHKIAGVETKTTWHSCEKVEQARYIYVTADKTLAGHHDARGSPRTHTGDTKRATWNQTPYQPVRYPGALHGSSALNATTRNDEPQTEQITNVN